MKNYVWSSHIWNLNFKSTLDGEMTKTKVVDLKKLYNFIIDNFFIWNNRMSIIREEMISHMNTSEYGVEWSEE
jgi:hypothetical protein